MNSLSDREVQQPRVRSYREAETLLLSFINYETKTRYRATTRSHDLERFARLLRRAGWQPRAVPTVHIGGTNAKGSVGWLLDRVLIHGGLATGLFSSPHLLSMRERIRLSGKPITRSAFRAGTNHMIRAFPSAPGAGFRTTFEHLTAMALLSFQEQQVDRSILEVGLGGRLDATNVIPPGPAILTPISLDHQHVLGATVSAIARDKAHILKPGGRGFIMPQAPEAMDQIATRAKALRIPWIETRTAVEVGWAPRSDAPGGVAHIRGNQDYGSIRTRLLGEHHRDVLAAVVCVAEAVLPRKRVREAVRAGLRGVVVPGRLETREVAGRRFLLDGGHNPAAGQAVARAVAGQFPGARVTAVVGMARDKDHRGYLRTLAPVVDRFIFTASRNPRAAAPGELAGRTRVPSRVARTVETALGMAGRGRSDIILVAGSFLLVAEAMSVLTRRPRPGDHRP